MGHKALCMCVPGSQVDHQAKSRWLAFVCWLWPSRIWLEVGFDKGCLAGWVAPLLTYVICVFFARFSLFLRAGRCQEQVKMGGTYCLNCTKEYTYDQRMFKRSATYRNKCHEALWVSQYRCQSITFKKWNSWGCCSVFYISMPKSVQKTGAGVRYGRLRL